MAQSGLAAMKQRIKERDEAANRVKADWFKATEEGNKIRFLQEIDPEATGYDPEQGLAIFAVERVSPFDFKKRAVCTLESEGQCYPEEWHQEAQRTGKDQKGEEYKGGWKQKTNFYISVLVERDGEKKVEILSRNFFSSFVSELIEEAEEEGTITGKTFTLKKKGSGPQTTWSLREAKTGQLEVGDAKAYDLDQVALRHVPYDQQPVFFGISANGGPQVADEAPRAQVQEKEDEEW